MSIQKNPDSILSRLTIEEKASLTSGATFWTTAAVDHAGVPSLMMTDGPHGIRKQSTGGDHLGILEGEPATCFPPAVGLGSSWDTELVERVGVALGREALAKQISVLLGPGINMKRDPRCGRNFEYLSEDPIHSSGLGAAFVRGVQSQGIGTSLKHYAANNQETARLQVSANIDERTLRELYLRAFQRVVTQEQPWTVMCAYNKVNGTYASEHSWLLNEVLRGEWGFKGVVVSDWGAVHDRVAALRAGLDLEMPGTDGRTNAEIVKAIGAGSLSQEILDTSAVRLLELSLKAEANLRRDAEVDFVAHHTLAREAAGRSIVLLKNEGAILPLDRSTERLAVIGEFARTPRYQGAGSSQIVPTRLDNPLDEIQRLASSPVSFAEGYRLDGSDDAAIADAAVETARNAGTVLYFVGLHSSDESEGFDRDHIDLPADQLQLLERLLAVNRRIIVVLSNGGVVQVSGWGDNVPGIIEGWLLGQAGGGAIADVVFGEINPSGKLTESIPLRLEDAPTFTHFPGELGSVSYGEGLYIGYRYYDTKKAPVSFPFGFGLSYTTFDFSDCEVQVSEEAVTITVTIANTGTRDGREVVQVYTGLPGSPVSRPVHELRAFAAVEVSANTSKTVTLSFPVSDLAYYNVVAGKWVVEGGDYVIEVGTSSRDIHYREAVAVPGNEQFLPLSSDSTIGEWRRHAVGGPALESLLAQIFEAQPRLKTMTSNSSVMRMAEHMPLKQIAAFGGVTGEALDTLVASVATE